MLKAKRLILSALIAVLSGCGTVTPDPVRDEVATMDSSVPSQYDPAAGWVLYQLPDGSGILTDNGKARWEALVGAYRVQFADTYKVTLDAEKTVEPYQDAYGNRLWKLSGENLEYFCRLGRWAKSGRPNDSAWQKLKAGATGL